MILADTSVWIEHFRKADKEMELYLGADQVLVHPFVLGELSLSSRIDRKMVLHRLSLLEAIPAISDYEVVELVDRFRLWGRGLGWVDCHLLASAREAHAHLVTRDLALKAAWLQVRKPG